MWKVCEYFSFARNDLNLIKIKLRLNHQFTLHTQPSFNFPSRLHNKNKKKPKLSTRNKFSSFLFFKLDKVIKKYKNPNFYYSSLCASCNQQRNFYPILLPLLWHDNGFNTFYTFVYVYEHFILVLQSLFGGIVVGNKIYANYTCSFPRL